jgi:hypothetical protein
MHADTVPCLVELAEEFDIVGPKRDHASDGSIGDQAHQDRSSNHNRDDVSGSNTPQTDSDNRPDIRAIDVDDSGPFLNGFTMQKGVDFIVSRCKSGVENRLVEVIYNRRCAYASSGWVWKDYTGSNAHTEHAHFGAKADSGKLENDRRPWGIAEKWGDGMSMTPEELRANVLQVLQSDEGKKALGLGTDNGMEAQKPGGAADSYATMLKHSDTNSEAALAELEDVKREQTVQAGKLDQILALLNPPPA